MIGIKSTLFLSSEKRTPGFSRLAGSFVSNSKPPLSGISTPIFSSLA
jgi:hypothetical protein